MVRRTAGRTVELGLWFIGCAYAVGAAVGLPLYGDGAYYFFRIVVDGAPDVPNFRYAAVLPQLPTLAATWLSADVDLLRHCFSITYAALPVFSLLGCWIVVRRSAPALILLPALFFTLNQINFSAVSELLLCLYLAWPYVLLAGLYPRHPATWCYGAALTPLLLLLHPLAFGLALFLAVAAVIAARSAGDTPRVQRIWSVIAAGLAISGVLRLAWTLIGSNSYERSFADASQVGYYLLPTTPGQIGLMLAVCAAALLLAPVLIRGTGQADGTWPVWLLLPVLAVWVGAEILAGDGVKLKAALIYPFGLCFMGLALWGARASTDRHATRGHGSGRRYARPFAACVLAIVLLTLAKSAAWWTATRGLINATASADGTCLAFGPQAPYALQWPWMAIIDNWTAPIAALVFRGPWPIPLLLPKDGCTLLRQTGTAHLTAWTGRPESLLAARFGPLRHAHGACVGEPGCLEPPGPRQ
ncbi:hypothetical protein [uncultured Lamprocystis sp.]|uniref:hypothetical protein n=1 Tax=uncultured Lamprocystis sp. TaxID=543132 RepID=UPI0025CD071D|nr:hypothetical protein [uncultured Lamprocystis sp.]